MQEFKMPFSEKTASIGISFNVPNKKETIIIGSPEDVKRYFTTGILSENADKRTRKIGTLIDEMNDLAQAVDGDRMSAVISASNGLCGVLNSGQGNKSASEFTEILKDLYDTSANANMLFNYIIFFIMTNFNLNHKTLAGEFHLSVKQMKKSAEHFAEQYNALRFRYAPAVQKFADRCREKRPLLGYRQADKFGEKRLDFTRLLVTFKRHLADWIRR